MAKKRSLTLEIAQDVLDMLSNVCLTVSLFASGILKTVGVIGFVAFLVVSDILMFISTKYIKACISIAILNLIFIGVYFFVKGMRTFLAVTWIVIHVVLSIYSWLDRPREKKEEPEENQPQTSNFKEPS